MKLKFPLFDIVIKTDVEDFLQKLNLTDNTSFTFSVSERLKKSLL